MLDMLLLILELQINRSYVWKKIPTLLCDKAGYNWNCSLKLIHKSQLDGLIKYIFEIVISFLILCSLHVRTMHTEKLYCVLYNVFGSSHFEFLIHSLPCYNLSFIQLSMAYDIWVSLTIKYSGVFGVIYYRIHPKKIKNLLLSLLIGKSSIWKNWKVADAWCRWTFLQWSWNYQNVTLSHRALFVIIKKPKRSVTLLSEGYFSQAEKVTKKVLFFFAITVHLKNVINCANSMNYKCMSYLGLSKQNKFSLIFLSYGPEHLYTILNTNLEF